MSAYWCFVSLRKGIWDLLVKEREDCQFIFITHSVDFVLGRREAKIAWIRKFDYPDNWEFEFVGDNFLLPRTMLTEVLGSKNSILFCEGNDKSSLDYQIYRALLGEKYTVIPVGGHLNVIKYCDVVAGSEWLNIRCVGVIDGDNYPESRERELKIKNVQIIPFNEIEMFLLSDEVLEHTMKIIFPTDWESRINTFKEKFWDYAKGKMEEIALTYTKMMVDNHFQNQKIERFKNILDIKNGCKKISELNIDDIYKKNFDMIIKVMDGKRYEELLKVCNLKKEISVGLANKFLDNNYELKAIQQITTNQDLKEKLVNKYYAFI